MRVYNACTSCRHLELSALTRRERIGLRWPRRKSEVLEYGEEIVYARDHKPPTYAGRGGLLRRMECRWEVGGKWWGRRSCKSLRKIVSPFSFPSQGFWLARGSMISDRTKKCPFTPFVFSTVELFSSLSFPLLWLPFILLLTYHGFFAGFFFLFLLFFFFLLHLSFLPFPHCCRRAQFLL